MSQQPCVTTYFSRKRKWQTEPAFSKRKRPENKHVFARNEMAAASSGDKSKVSVKNIKRPQKSTNLSIHPFFPCKQDIKLRNANQRPVVDAPISNIARDDSITNLDKNNAENLVVRPKLSAPIFDVDCECSPEPIDKEPTLLRSGKASEEVGNGLTQMPPNASGHSVQALLQNKNKLKELQNALLKITEQKKKSDSSKSESNNEVVNVKEKREYAYSKSHLLARSIPKGLILPHKCEVLKEMFISLDTTVSMLFNRQETAAWSKVKNSVTKITNNDFSLVHLAQIKQVFPEAFRFRQENNIVSYSNPSKRSKYELTLEPIFKEANSQLQKKMTSSILIRRKHQFHLKLLDIVKIQHQKFLNGLSPPIQAEDSQLRRWHPDFDLNCAEDIPAAELPASPEENRLRCMSAKEALEKSRSKLTKKAAEALERVALINHQPNSMSNDANNNSPTLLSSARFNPKLKGLSPSLLAKINKKEAEKKSRLMIRSEEDCARLDELRRLPHVARSLRMLFIKERKSALPMIFIASELSESSALLPTPYSMEKHVRLLSEQVPTWFNVVPVRNQDYGRILNKNKPIADVIEDLEACVKRAEKA